MNLQQMLIKNIQFYLGSYPESRFAKLLKLRGLNSCVGHAKRGLSIAFQKDLQ